MPTGILNIIPQNIPLELRDLKQWVCWKLETREGKPTKVPYNPVTGRHAKTNNSTTWCSFDACCKGIKKYDGIGIILSGNLTGIDIDHCLNEKGQLNFKASLILSHLKKTFADISPSGTGAHIYGYGKPKRNGKGTKHKDIEVYNHSSPRYLTVTGHTFNGHPQNIADCQDGLDFVHDFFMSKNPFFSVFEKIRASKNADNFFHLWEGNWNGYPTQSEADQALCNHLVWWFGKNAETIDKLFKWSKLYRDKWDKRHYSNGDTYGQRTIQKAIDFCKETWQDGKKKPTVEPVFDDDLAKRAKAVLKEATKPCESFDTSCLPDILRNYIDSICEQTDAEPIMVTSSVLSCVSAFLKHRIYIPEGIDGYFQKLYANIWTLCCAGSGDFKTTALKKGFAVAFENDSQFKNISPKDLTRDDINKITVMPSRATPEGLIELLANGFSGAIIQSELGGWLASLEKTHNIDLKSLLTDFYDVPEFYNYYTKTAGLIRVERPYISISGVSTPEWINKHYKPDDLSSGFFARFLVFYPPPSSKIPHARPQRVKRIDQNAVEQVKGVLYNLPEQREYRLNDISSDFDSFHNELYEQFDRLPTEFQNVLAPFLKRWSPSTLKISMLLQPFVDISTDRLSIEALYGATELINQAMTSTVWLFQNVLGESEHLNKRRKILTYIAKRGGKVSWTNLIMSRVLDGGSSEYEYIVKTLDEAQQIEIIGSLDKKKNMIVSLATQNFE